MENTLSENTLLKNTLSENILSKNTLSKNTLVGARDAWASKNNWGPLSSTFHVEQPETLIEWKFKSMTDGPTNRLTWVGARDTCVSKNAVANKKMTNIRYGYLADPNS